MGRRDQLILTGEGGAFSAGLDLPLLVEYGRAELEGFLADFHRTFLRFACLPRPTIAAINGHAVAGGAVIAAACDLRIGVRTILGKGKAPLFGINETAIGLPFPRCAQRIVESAIGDPGHRFEMFMTGELFGPDDALRLGAFTQLVDPEELSAAAEKQARRLAGAGAFAAATVKQELKRELYDLAQTEATDLPFVEAWFSEETQRRLRQVVDQLARK